MCAMKLLGYNSAVADLVTGGNCLHQGYKYAAQGHISVCLGLF